MATFENFEFLVQSLDSRHFDAVEFQRADALVVAAGVEGGDKVLGHWTEVRGSVVRFPFVVPLGNRHLGQLLEHHGAIHWLNAFLSVAVGDAAPGAVASRKPNASSLLAGGVDGRNDVETARGAKSDLVGRRGGKIKIIAIGPQERVLVSCFGPVAGGKAAGACRISIPTWNHSIGTGNAIAVAATQESMGGVRLNGIEFPPAEEGLRGVCFDGIELASAQEALTNQGLDGVVVAAANRRNGSGVSVLAATDYARTIGRVVQEVLLSDGEGLVCVGL